MWAPRTANLETSKSAAPLPDRMRQGTLLQRRRRQRQNQHPRQDQDQDPGQRETQGRGLRRQKIEQPVPASMSSTSLTSLTTTSPSHALAAAPPRPPSVFGNGLGDHIEETKESTAADLTSSSSSKLRIAVDDDDLDGAELAEEAKSPGSAAAAPHSRLEELHAFLRELATYSPRPKLVRQTTSAQRLPRLARWRSEERQQVEDAPMAHLAPRPQSTRSRGISVLDGVVRKMQMRRSSSKSASSSALPEPSVAAARERTLSSPDSHPPQKLTLSRSRSAAAETGKDSPSSSEAANPLPTAPPPSPLSRFRFSARARTPPGTKRTNPRRRQHDASAAAASDEADFEEKLAWWRARADTMVELLTQAPNCLTSVLNDDQVALMHRKRLAQEVLDICVAHVDDDPSQQLLLVSLAEAAFADEFSTRAPVQKGESAAAGAIWLRTSSTAATILISAYVQRAECKSAANSLLDAALDPTLDKNGVSSDPAILAERILRRIQPDAFPVGIRLLCRQLSELAPAEARESMLGAFLVLKYINPVLVSGPRGIYPQRVLVDTARHLQHLANHAASVSAPVKAATLDDFLIANRSAMLAALDLFADPELGSSKDSDANAETKASASQTLKNMS